MQDIAEAKEEHQHFQDDTEEEKEIEGEEDVESVVEEGEEVEEVFSDDGVAECKENGTLSKCKERK